MHAREAQDNVEEINRERSSLEAHEGSPKERNNCGSGVRSAMHAASQLPGRGPTVDDVPAPAC